MRKPLEFGFCQTWGLPRPGQGSPRRHGGLRKALAVPELVQTLNQAAAVERQRTQLPPPGASAERNCRIVLAKRPELHATRGARDESQVVPELRSVELAQLVARFRNCSSGSSRGVSSTILMAWRCSSHPGVADWAARQANRHQVLTHSVPKLVAKHHAASRW